MSQSSILFLTADHLELVLTPEVGGSIARFDRMGANGRLSILRGADGVPARVLDAACFPLVPYCNRIRNGRFTFRGRTVQLTPNMAGDPSPLHGQGWLSAWTVAAAERSSAELLFRHEPGEWPWEYEARLRYSLAPDALDIELACRNMADEPMPCGLGLHPYFPCEAGTGLETHVEHVWTVDKNVLPVARVPATGRFALDGGPACGRDLDNGYDGWSGVARITRPGDNLEIRMSSPDARFFQLYSPPDNSTFVAEPVTHANAALNEPEEKWPELGMRVLAPGETMSLAAQFRLLPLGD